MAINKVFNSFDEAIADMKDGVVILLGGFGGVAPVPQNLTLAVHRKGVKNLTVVTNNAGVDGRLGLGNIGGKPYVDHEIWVTSGQVEKFIGAVPASIVVSKPNALEQLYREGKVELEIVPQGTLAERIRAGGAGIGAFYTPVGVGTEVEKGKETKVINGKKMLLEYAIKGDWALVRAHKADTTGNLVYTGVMRTLNAVMATAAETVVAEVDEIVEPGELDPEAVVTPGIFVDRIVKIKEGDVR
jgi:3-oxoadipate CoA-transferase alpha subunit